MSAQIMVKKIRASFCKGRTQSINFRENQLRCLLRMYQENRNSIVKALYQDLRKSKMEACLTEVELLIRDVHYTLEHLYEWTQDEIPPKRLIYYLDDLRIIQDPYGVVLIMGSWNYPFQLTLLPLHGAIAAGNCAIIKPSEISHNSAKLLSALIPRYLDQDCFQVYLGGINKTKELLKEHVDYIFYTGSLKVGKLVYQAANQYLTPVTLELGGKNPVYLDNLKNLDIAVSRILWGKFLNAGQTSIAPDYLLCSKKMQTRFVKKAKEILNRFYGVRVKCSPDLCRIVNDFHFKRISAYLKDGIIVIGGHTDASKRFIEPTILIDAHADDLVMQEEIFGPVLPIVTVENHLEAIKFIKAFEKPLAFYIFSENRVTIKQLVKHVSAGGICVNDTIAHTAIETLPFGGVGMSGIGKYHGKSSFDTFTHKKSVLIRNMGSIAEGINELKYPPYTLENVQKFNFLMRYRSSFSFEMMSYFVAFGLGFGSVFLGNYLLAND